MDALLEWHVNVLASVAVVGAVVTAVTIWMRGRKRRSKGEQLDS